MTIYSSLSTYPRWKAWLLVSVFSIALAEVSIGSSPFGLLHPVEVVVLGVVYGAQVLVLAGFVFRNNPAPRLSALWSAGFILGLYEFYLTKVMWDQPWDGLVNPGLFEPVSFIILAGFWHAYMAFIFPLAITEGLMVKRPHIAGLLPPWFRNPKTLTFLGLFGLSAIATGSFTAVPFDLWIALPYTALVLWAAVKWLAPEERIERLGDILPTRRQSGFLLIPILAVYVIMYQTQRTGIIITPERHWLVWALYGLGASLLLRTLERSGTSEPVDFDIKRVRWQHFLAYFAIATAAVLIPASQVVGVLWVWGAGGVVAVVSFVSAVADSLPKRQGDWLRCHLLRQTL